MNDAEDLSPNEAVRRFKAAFAPFWDLATLLADVEADATPFLSAGGWRQEKAESILSWKRRAMQALRNGDAESAAVYALKVGASAEWLRAADVISSAEEDDFEKVTPAEVRILAVLSAAKDRPTMERLSEQTGDFADGGFRMRVSALVKRGFIGNKGRRDPGYFLKPKGRRFLYWHRNQATRGTS